jgi:hypothetical protein
MRFETDRVVKEKETIVQQNLRIRKEREKLQNWHKHFCWIPVLMGNQIIWLETVERRFPNARYENVVSSVGAGYTDLTWCWNEPEYREAQQYD